MQVNDDLYLGNAQAIGNLQGTAGLDPTLQAGVGPMGRVAFHNVIPLTKSTTNVATAHHLSTGVAVPLTAGTGVTAVLAPDGSGATVYQFDTPRCVALTSSADMHTISVTVVGYDFYGQKMTQTKALGSSATTVNTTKAFYSVLSVTPNGTDGTNTLSVGSADIFGLPFAAVDAGYFLASWAETYGIDAGTFVAADTTSPATVSTGDVRGTYAPSSSSNGTKRLVCWIHLPATASGPSSTLVGAIGQPQV